MAVRAEAARTNRTYVDLADRVRSWEASKPEAALKNKGGVPTAAYD